MCKITRGKTKCDIYNLASRSLSVIKPAHAFVLLRRAHAVISAIELYCLIGHTLIVTTSHMMGAYVII